MSNWWDHQPIECKGLKCGYCGNKKIEYRWIDLELGVKRRDIIPHAELICVRCNNGSYFIRNSTILTETL